MPPDDTPHLRQMVDEFNTTEAEIRGCGGPAAIDRQHARGRLTCRERIARLVDQPEPAPTRADADQPAPDVHRDEIHNFQELGLWAAHEMYADHGAIRAAGVVVGVGVVHGRPHMIIANDGTVKAGAFFPMTAKKVIRAQEIAMMARLPLVYLVDCGGVYLPLQEEVFPDRDDFGRVFRNNACLSAAGVPQIAAIMGNCVAGGGYLPVLCDTLLMTEGSGLYVAGPALVKAAIRQDISDEDLGGATMHAEISGTIDFKEPDDKACLVRIRELLKKHGGNTPPENTPARGPVRDPHDVYEIYSDAPGAQHDVRDILACVVDARAYQRDGGEHLEPDFDEYRADFARSVVCGYATIGGHAVGVVANQAMLTDRLVPGGREGPQKTKNLPRVLYEDGSDKAARFVMDCNQRKIPLVFLHNTTGFMVGRDAEQAGIIKAGAKLVNAVANSVVPKLVVVIGGTYGAGHYAMCGRAFDQFLCFAWPSARYAVMSANSATSTLATIEENSRKKKGQSIDKATHERILAAVRADYEEQQDIRHGAARGWVDRIIRPHRTREELVRGLDAAAGWDWSREFKVGVYQV